jgi:hypothetical protein
MAPGWDSLNVASAGGGAVALHELTRRTGLAPPIGFGA